MMTSWKTAVSGEFTDGTKWTLGVPGTSDDALIAQTGTYTVELKSVSKTVQSLTLFAPSATLDVQSGLTGAISVQSGTLLDESLVEVTAIEQWNGAIVFEGPSAPALGADQSLTFGASCQVGFVPSQIGSALFEGLGQFVNFGTMRFEASTLGLVQLQANLINNGLLAIGTHTSVLAFSNGSIANAGTIAITSGGLLKLSSQSSFTSTGTIVIDTFGVLENDNLTTTSQLAGFLASNSGLQRTATGLIGFGVLNNANATIDLSTSGQFRALELKGLLQYGTLVLHDGFLNYDGGALVGVTVIGTIDLTKQNLRDANGAMSLQVGNGITVRDSTSSQSGTIDMRASGASVSLQDSETFSQITILMGGAGPASSLHVYNNILTLATDARVLATGSAAIDGLTLINRGLISASGTGSNLAISATTFNTAATLAIAGLGTFTAAASTNVTNSGLVSVSGGAQAIFAGTTPGGLQNTGTITADGGVVSLAGAVGGTGVLDVRGGGTLIIGSTAANAKIEFGGPGTITLGNEAQLLGTIHGFFSGDTIDLANTTAGFAKYAGGQIEVFTSQGGTPVGNINVADVYAPTTVFTVTQNGADALITTSAVCFAEGSRILTVRGEIAIGDLRAGDLVITGHSRRRAPIIWIGRQHLTPDTHASPSRVRPVRVRRSAFGPDVPHRDLVLSPEHAVLVDDVLVPVRCLINGRTIAQEPAARITYLHIELAAHDIVFAEGLAVETWLDAGHRSLFADPTGVARLSPGRTGQPCRPIVTSGEMTVRLRDRLAA